jgi:hypothetical protein
LQFKEQNSVSSQQPLDVALAVSSCHVVCPMHEVPWPQVTPLPQGVPAATPAPHDEIEMKSDAQMKAETLIRRATMEGS